MTAAFCTLLLAVASVPCLLYAVPFLLGRWRKKPPPHADPLRLCVLIPAHNEAVGLPRTLRAVFAADYPPGLLRVLVVADNCTDGTATVAKLHGAEVVTRTDPANRGKGHALAFGLPHALTGAEAVIVLDADCTVNADFLKRMSDTLRTAEAVQAAVVSRPNGTPAGYVAAVGAGIDNAVAAGADRLGGRVPLRGTGMGFRRELLERLPWSAFGLAEDAEYAAVLARHKVRVRWAAGAEVVSDAPGTSEAFAVQRTRWSSALRLNPLASKPLLLAHLLATSVIVLSLVPDLFFVIWLALLLALTTGMYAAAAWPLGRPPVSSVKVVAKLLAVAVNGVRRKGGEWQRTPRS